MTPELRATLEAQRAVVEAKQKKTGSVIPWVFHRTKRGRQLKGFRKAWCQACLDAGVPGRILHDFRRTAVRNLERAGVPRSVATKMVGHKTESVYRRYAIVDESMLREAAVKLAARRGQSTGQSGVVIIEPMSGKDLKKLVGRDGTEPPTPGFSVLATNHPHRLPSQRLDLSSASSPGRAKWRPVACCCASKVPLVQQ
jgi:Phage integrase family